jgi:hypothetical protein
MNAAFGKLRTFGVLLILAVGLLLASATLVAADAGVPPDVDGHAHRVAGDVAVTVENLCVAASPQSDCSTCCHDMGSSLCCGHFVALGTEANARPYAIHHVVTGLWIPVAMHGASAEVGKRPPRYAA